MSRITLASADFSNSLDYALPVEDGCEYFNFFRGGAQNLTRNLVKNKPAVAQTGAPVNGSGYATFTGNSAFLQTGIADRQEFTWLAAVRASADNAYAAAISTYEGGSALTRGQMLCVSDIQSTHKYAQLFVTMNNSGAFSGGISVVGNPVDQEWRFIFGRVAASARKVMDITENSQDSDANPYAISANSRMVRIGSGYGSAETASIDVAFAAVFSQSISDEEVTSIYTRVKKTLQLDSITV